MEQKNKTVVFGNQGFIGRNFFNFYKAIYPDSIGTHYNNSKYIFDLLNPDISKLSPYLKEYSWGLIVSGNAKIADCEKNKQLSYKCNVEGIISLTQQLINLNITPIFISTDYVFDGIQGNYEEGDYLNPLNEYGKQRVDLEQKIYNLCNGRCLILRLSKIFSIYEKDNTFLNEIASSLIKGKVIKAAYDQIFSPILIEDFISATIALQKKNANGIFHICGIETINRYEVALKMAKLLEVNIDQVKKISLDSLKEPFIRPKNTSMNCSKLKKIINFQPHKIDYCINRVVENFTIQSI